MLKATMKLKLLIIFSILALTAPSFASYMEEKINHLGEIEKYVDRSIEEMKNEGIVNPEKKVLVILDWDRTVSKEEGKFTPLSESRGHQDLKSTSDMIKSLNEKGVRIMVLTARGGGDTYTAEQIAPYSEPMKQAAGLSGSSAFKPEVNEATALKLPNGTVAMITNYVVFAGNQKSTSKAPAVKEMLDQDLLKDKPLKIIFADNSHRHLEGFQDIFGGRPESVTALYYPKYGDENK